MEIRSHECPHEFFLEKEDAAQSHYEQARKAVLNQRVRFSDDLKRRLGSHGVAGLFLDLEGSIISCHPQARRRSSRKGTALAHTHLPEAEFETISRSLAEGVGISTTNRIQGRNKRTVLRVLARSADHVSLVSRSLLRNVVVPECQLDELWSFIAKKEGHLDPLEKLSGEIGDAWIWVAFDAVHKVVLAYVVGKRTEPHAVALLEEVKRVTAFMPALFSSDQLDQYKNALLKVYGRLVTPPCKPGPGRPPNSRWVPPEDLLYVQVVKEYRANRIVKVDRRLIFGDEERLQHVLAESPVSRKINTSHVERNNATIRHLDARCNRKTYRFSKVKKNHIRQLALSLSYYHLCLPHATLTKRHGRPTTPFMAAGLTDHVWTMRELLRYRPDDPCC